MALNSKLKKHTTTSQEGESRKHLYILGSLVALFFPCLLSKDSAFSLCTGPRRLRSESRVPCRKKRGREKAGRRAELGEQEAGSEPGPRLLPPKFAERKELQELFALSSVNQVAG